MAESGIPDDVRRLIASSIYSVTELELLLFLRAHNSRAWTGDELAKAAYLDPQATERMLFDLLARGFVVATRVLPVAYRYAPKTPEMTRTIERLADLYATRRVTITNLIFERPHESPRLFSEPFRPQASD